MNERPFVECSVASELIQQLFICGVQLGREKLAKKMDVWASALIWSQHIRWRIIKKSKKGRIVENRLYYRNWTHGERN